MSAPNSRSPRRIGHLGDATVEHTAYHLPIIVTEFLEKALAGPDAPIPPPDVVSDLLSRSITSFDDAIAGDVLDLFPGGLASLAARSDEEISRVINDFEGDGVNYKKARLCMYGTTALVALVDPEYKNLWVAGLGDCEAGKRVFSVLSAADANRPSLGFVDALRTVDS